MQNVLTDRGSKYAVSGADAKSKSDVTSIVKDLKKKKKFLKATHNSWAIILSDGTQLKSDDGEAGAGAVMLRVLENASLRDHVVIVTRWFGGVHLGGDRFRHVTTCVQLYLQDLEH